MNSEINSSVFMQEVLQVFQGISDVIIVKKGEFLLREGEIEKYLYYIEEGAVKLYYLSDSEEKVIRLGYNGSMINSLSSFLSEQPSEFYIETIRQTKIKRISKDQLNSIISRDITGYAKFLEVLLTQQLDREIDLLVTSPAERLKRVLKRSPDLFQHVPMKYIASYLRMNPETLSRIRNS